MKRHGVGLHSSVISKSELYETVFVAPKLPAEDHYIEPDGYSLIELKTGMTKRPRGISKFGAILFHLSRLWEIVRISIESIRVYEGDNYEIVHIHSPMYSLIAIWCKLRGARTFITYHGTDYLRVRNSSLFKRVAKKYIDVGVCISPHMVEVMSEFHSHVEYIYNGVDSDEFVDKSLQRERFILAVGSLKYEKAYDRLIEGFARFSTSYPEYSLFIAGDGEKKGDMNNQIKELGLEKHVKLLGNLDKEELISHYNRCSGYILSSHSEGFPKVLLEAIFCGARTIANDVGSVSSFLPEAVIMPNNEFETIADYLTKLVEGDIDYSSINISQLKETYSWDCVIKKYNELYGVL